ncbi:MAG TPA: hypothetical protein PLN38_08290 [Chitinophagales bacterium]|nr:hypothetical protein [Chitinophagales bacterium]
MLKKTIDINGCKHYMTSVQSNIETIITTPYYVEPDGNILHPFGTVYKAKNVIDTCIRFVVQKDNSLLLFNAKEWLNKNNPYINPSYNIKSLNDILIESMCKLLYASVAIVLYFTESECYPEQYEI